MKKILLLIIIFISLKVIAFSQNRNITSTSEPGELYLFCGWYGIYSPIYPWAYDTLQTAIYRITENGKKLTIQYDIDAFAYPADTVVPYSILADATSGAIYVKTYYSKNSYPHTSLWVSFDYGISWVRQEEKNGNVGYFGTGAVDGTIYTGGQNREILRSRNYGESFEFEFYLPLGYGIRTSANNNCEFLGFGKISQQYYLHHTNDCADSFTIYPIETEFVYGTVNYRDPDVFPGGLSGEVYVSSWFPDDRYRVSFSADTGHSFRHVYVSDVYPVGGNTYLFFMSDREPGVFYILKIEQVEDFNPAGHHTKICIEYYRDYGETLVATYCHDLHKNYGKTCEAVNDLVSEKISKHSILLSWSEPGSSLPVIEYQIYRNEEFLTSITSTSFLDENLPVGNYEYYVIAHYEMGCVADSSNHVKIEIEVGIDEYLQPNFTIIPNPATNQITISSASPFHTVEVFDIYGRKLLEQKTTLTVLWSYDLTVLQPGIYFVRVFFEGGKSVRKLVKQ